MLEVPMLSVIVLVVFSILCVSAMALKVNSLRNKIRYLQDELKDVNNKFDNYSQEANNKIGKLIKKCEEYKSDFQSSEDDRATLTAERDETKLALDTLQNAHDSLRERYDNLFCEKEGCTNLKYYKFRFCSAHIEGRTSELDPDALSGKRPVETVPGEGPIDDEDFLDELHSEN